MATKFPRYPRSLMLNCKLTDIQIEKINELRRQKYTLESIAKQFNTTSSRVWYWCQTPAKRRLINHENYIKYPGKPNSVKDKQYRIRKEQLFHDKLKIYHQEKDRKRRGKLKDLHNEIARLTKLLENK